MLFHYRCVARLGPGKPFVKAAGRRVWGRLRGTGVAFPPPPRTGETQENHFLVLVAVDGGSVPLSATANLIVTVTDVDDNCPEFDADSPIRATVAGLGIKGAAVAQLKATDKDLGQNAQITFSFSRQISDRAKTLFHVDGHTGLISLAVDVQVDSSEKHMLKVLAISPLCPPAQTQVTVDIKPLASPELTIKIRFVAEHKDQVIVLLENEPPTVLALLEIQDTSSDKGTLSLEADSMPFSLKPQAGSYLLSTSKPLDFEDAQGVWCYSSYFWSSRHTAAWKESHKSGGWRCEW